MMQISEIKSASMLLLIVACLTTFDDVRSNEFQKIELPLEIAMVVVPYFNRGEYFYIARTFLDYFATSETYSRSAIVTRSASAKPAILLNLTGNEQSLKKVKQPKKIGTSDVTMLDYMDLIRREVFADARPHAQKMVVFFLIENYVKAPFDQVLGDEKRHGGNILIYGITFGQVRPEKDLDRIFHYDKIDEFAGRVYQQIGCKFEETCMFADENRKYCSAAWWRPKAGLRSCLNAKPNSLPGLLCSDQRAICSKLCDDAWPWSKNDSCDRGGPMPPQHKKVLESCARNRCNTSSTISRIDQSTTSPKTIDQSTISSKTIDQSMTSPKTIDQSTSNQSAMIQSTIEQASIVQSTIVQSTIGQSTTKQSTITKSTIKKSTIDQTTIDSEVQAERNVQSDSEKGKIPPWTIGLIATLIAVIAIVAIGIVVVTIRRRRRVQKRKKTISKKSEIEQRNKSIEMPKPKIETAKSITIDASKSKLAHVAMLQAQGAATEQNIEASLDDSTMAKPSARSSSGKPMIEMKRTSMMKRK